MTISPKASIVIRPSVLDDAVAMRRCAQAAFQLYACRIGKPPAPMLADYASIAAGPGAFVAEMDGKIVGMVVLEAKADGIWLETVAVFPEYQGKGIGGRLVRFAEQEAYKLGHRSLHLFTNEAMVENLEMYEHLGYREVGRRTDHGYCRVYMQKNPVSAECQHPTFPK